MAKLKVSFENGEGRQPTISYPISYVLITRQLRVLKKKDSMKNKRSHHDIFCKKVLQYLHEIHVLESLFNKVACLQCIILSKK